MTSIGQLLPPPEITGGILREPMESIRSGCGSLLLHPDASLGGIEIKCRRCGRPFRQKSQRLPPERPGASKHDEGACPSETIRATGSKTGS